MAFLRNAWYVAAWSFEVTDEMFPRRLLGEPVLIYRTKNGEPAAVQDRCPHRFAPLHLGRIRGDNVECGYHGLQFDRSGACVHNPHGNHVIPKACRIRAYPIVERYGVLWLWAGDPEHADPSTISDFGYLVEAGRKTVHGSILVRANYELINDNLMDASHTQYVHMDLLGTDAFARSKHEVTQDGETVHSNYVIPDSEIPTAYKDYFADQSQRVDYAVNFRWQPTSLVRNSVTLTPPAGTEGQRIERTGSHFMTPETETTTHYFFSHTRNFDLADPRVDARIRRWQQSGLTEQDGSMIEAVQKEMGASRFDELRPVLLSIDTAAVRVRRVLAKLITAEQQLPASVSTAA